MQAIILQHFYFLLYAFAPPCVMSCFFVLFFLHCGFSTSNILHFFHHYLYSSHFKSITPRKAKTALRLPIMLIIFSYVMRPC